MGVARPFGRRTSSGGARSRPSYRFAFEVLPSTAKAMNADTSAPAQNVLAGARYLLRLLLDRFESTELALAAYNAGPPAVEKTGDPITPRRPTRTR